MEPDLRRLRPRRRVRRGPLRRLEHALPLQGPLPPHGLGRRRRDRGRGPGPLPHDRPRAGDGLRHGRRQAHRDRAQAGELRPRRAVAAAVPRRDDRAHQRHALLHPRVRALAVHVQRRLRRRPRHRDVLGRRAPAPRSAGRPAAPDARDGRVRVAGHVARPQAAAAGQPAERRAGQLEQQPRARLRRGGQQLVLRVAASRIAAPGPDRPPRQARPRHRDERDERRGDAGPALDRADADARQPAAQRAGAERPRPAHARAAGGLAHRAARAASTATRTARWTPAPRR